MNILAFVQQQLVYCNMKENNNKLSLVFDSVDNVKQIMYILSKMIQ